MQFSCAFKSGPELIDPFTSVVLEMSVRWRGKDFNGAFLRVRAPKIMSSLYIRLRVPMSLPGPLSGMEANQAALNNSSFLSTGSGLCWGLSTLTAQMNLLLGSKSQWVRNRWQLASPTNSGLAFPPEASDSMLWNHISSLSTILLESGA